MFNSQDIFPIFTHCALPLQKITGYGTLAPEHLPNHKISIIFPIIYTLCLNFQKERLEWIILNSLDLGLSHYSPPPPPHYGVCGNGEGPAIERERPRRFWCQQDVISEIGIFSVCAPPPPPHHHHPLHLVGAYYLQVFILNNLQNRTNDC